MNKRPEILAPAGDWTMLRTAVKAGADAVYFGVEKLNMRAAAANFTVAELPAIVEFCKENNVATHLTVNSIVFENELGDLDEIIRTAKETGIDMVICWDMSVIQACKKYDIPFCISTQASISNSASANFYESLGASRIVLARECTLDKISEIRKKTKLEIEAFVHGAMCVAVSGRCFMSHEVFGKSANRGECYQPCRREYEIKDKDQGFSFILGEDYVMSPKDLSTIEFVEQLIEAGIDSFKIEGRKRSPEYIATVVSSYRKAVDLYFEGKLTEETKKSMTADLAAVYNRGFSSGFYFGTPGSDAFANSHGSVASTKKVYAGKVLNYYKQTEIVHARLEAESISSGDHIYIIGSTTGLVQFELAEMLVDDSEAESAPKGSEVTFKCGDLVRPGDKIYKVVASGK